jgi:AcrR family transcriptional regulator
VPNGKKKQRRLGRPRSLESERAIIDATMELLNEGGYGGLTLAKVAKRAGASKATIYRRWPTKEHLVVAAVSHFPQLVAHDKGSLVEELLDLQRQHLRRMHTPRLHSLMPQLTAERAHNPALATALDPYVERRREPVRTVFRQAIARGEIPAETNIETAVDIVSGVGYLRLYLPSPSSGDASLESMREVYELLLRGLQASAHDNRGGNANSLTTACVSAPKSQARDTRERARGAATGSRDD